MQVLDNLLLVRWLDTSKALRAAGGAGLLTLAEIVEFLASVSLAKGLLISGEDTNLAANGDGSVLNIFKFNKYFFWFSITPFLLLLRKHQVLIT